MTARRARAAAWVVVVAATPVVACAGGEPACGDGPGFDARLEDPVRWDEVLEVRSVGEHLDLPDDRSVTADVVLRDAGAVTMTAHGPTAEDLVVTSGAGHPVLVGWTGDRDLRTAIADVDGRAVFLGVCGDHATDHLDRLAEWAQGGTFALVEEWVDEGADSTLGRILRPIGPQRGERALTGGDLDGRTASMIPLTVVIEAPPAWADPRLTIATRVPAGWNDGVPLDVAARPGSSGLAGYAVAGDELEVVVSGGGGTFVVGSTPLVPTAGWDPGSPLLVRVSISGPPAEAALPELPAGIELPLGATVTLDVRA